MNDLAKVQRAMSKTSRALIWTNVALTAALALVLTLGRLSAPGAAEIDPQKATGIQQQRSAHLDPADTRRIITGKALFRTTGPVVRERVVDELAQFELKGISMRGGVPQAHVRDNRLKRLVTRRVGDTLGAYEIIEISDEGITVKRGAETVILSKG